MELNIFSLALKHSGHWRLPETTILAKKKWPFSSFGLSVLRQLAIFWRFVWPLKARIPMCTKCWPQQKSKPTRADERSHLAAAAFYSLEASSASSLSSLCSSNSRRRWGRWSPRGQRGLRWGTGRVQQSLTSLAGPSPLTACPSLPAPFHVGVVGAHPRRSSRPPHPPLSKLENWSQPAEHSSPPAGQTFHAALKASRTITGA